MQLDIFSSLPLYVAAWAARARNGRSIILFLPDPRQALEAGLGGALREAGCKLVGTHTKDKGLYLCLDCPPTVVTQTLAQLPQPRNQGSNTVTNYLPW